MDSYLIYLTIIGDENAWGLLRKKYRPYIFSIAKRFLVENNCFIKEYYDDLISNGDNILVSSIYSYDINSPASFHTYFNLLLSKSFFRHIRYLRSNKKRGERSQISFSNLPLGYETIESNHLVDEKVWHNPEKALYVKDEFDGLKSPLEQMTTLERNTFNYVILGYTVKQTAKILNVNYRSAENAINRAKMKIKKYYDEKEK